MDETTDTPPSADTHETGNAQLDINNVTSGDEMVIDDSDDEMVLSDGDWLQHFGDFVAFTLLL